MLLLHEGLQRSKDQLDPKAKDNSCISSFQCRLTNCIHSNSSRFCKSGLFIAQAIWNHMDKITIRTQYLAKPPSAAEADEVQVWIEVVITNQVVLCKNWFDSDTIANFDTSHITSDFYNFTREFMSQSDRCFLTRIHVLQLG